MTVRPGDATLGTVRAVTPPDDDRPAAADPFADVADAFALTHYGDQRGRIRTAVIDRQLRDHLAGHERIVDVGGGSAVQDLPLARRGHRVVVVDPSAAMLTHARTRLAAEPADVAERISLVQAPGETATAAVGVGRFDVACCHGVLMYLDDPGPLLAELVRLVRPGGLVSIVAANRHALAFRPGLRGDHAEALALLTTGRYRNGLGRTARADDPEALGDRLRAVGADPVAWYGVRTFSDAWPPGHHVDDVDQVIALELAASRTDPYRQASRLFHLLAHTPTIPTAPKR